MSSYVQMKELLFPMIGHFYLPTDRIFARIEKEVKMHEARENPNNYINILKKHGTIIHIPGIVYDWKSTC